MHACRIQVPPYYSCTDFVKIFKVKGLMATEDDCFEPFSLDG